MAHIQTSYYDDNQIYWHLSEKKALNITDSKLHEIFICPLSEAHVQDKYQWSSTVTGKSSCPILLQRNLTYSHHCDYPAPI